MAGPAPEVPAWPAPSGLPAAPPAPYVAETPVLPMPYAPPEPHAATVPDAAHWRAEGEQPLVAAAHVAVHEERFADAVRLLEEFLREYPADARAWHRLAGARIGLGHHVAALAAADQSLEREPDSAAGHRMRALALYYLRRIAEAEQSATRSAELDPSSADGHALLAELLNQQGRTEAAVAAARIALTIAPGHPAALRVIAADTSSLVRVLPLVTAGAFPAALVLGVLALALAGSPPAAIYGAFAAVAVLPLFAAILRWAVGSRGLVLRPLPGGAFVATPILASAFATVPVLLAGTHLPGAIFVPLLTAVLSAAFTAGLYQRRPNR
ncbi:hypothetical protein GCM10010168_06940 [Actinoplanes ianthinogenes]|uniref:Tetratricopeptide repeat protein n=1 Tax=Actinoplanes ianthinogenes TaxID=122358 RepID=A0ABM7LTG1_9ACTN|nr:tetratricopeptide repeat protein [Actinoplanes ianthinogenes]BCJ42564.1 hypothetical protein Aiant_32210 [Actinoplanes ianthinogenes]GGQ93714.1 hypothetical protein GCM10010168_06940 [Actinoplanes ianthinogenes]